jgi:hypothetical protein
MKKHFHLFYSVMIRIPNYRASASGFDSRGYIFLDVLVLERDALSLVMITEELFGRSTSGSILEKTRLTAVGTRCADHVTLLPAKVGISFAGRGGRVVGIVRLRNYVHVIWGNLRECKLSGGWETVRGANGDGTRQHHTWGIILPLSLPPFLPLINGMY